MRVTTGTDQAERAIKEALRPFLSGANVLRVESRPTADEADHEVLRIMVVLDRRPGEEWTALDAIGAVQQALASTGEARFPVMDFVTEDELGQGDGVEP